MRKNQMRFALCALAAFSFSCVSAWAQEGLRDFFSRDAALPDSGTLYHYAIRLDPKKPAIDYWLRRSEDGSARTLYDSKRIDGSGILSETWMIDWENFRIESCRAENLAPAKVSSYAARSYLYDWNARKLKFMYEYADPAKRAASYEAIPYAPEAWQRELGIFFTLFFPFLEPESGTFRISYDSFGHVNFMKVSAAGEEEINGIACRKYRVRGEGLLSSLFPQGGYVWLAKDDPRHFLVKHTMRQFFCWQMPNFSIELVDEKPTTDEEWETLREQTASTPASR